MFLPRPLCLPFVLLGLACTSMVPAEEPTTPSRLTAFNVDFNWGPGGTNGFAPAGTFAKADPAAHYQWHKDLGSNVIWTFGVTCDGYAWYRNSGVAPVQPGLEHDFLNEQTELGHRDGKLIIAYFCVGANMLWAERYPEQSYGRPSAVHIPFTNDYLDYFCASIRDVLTKTEIDGIQLDWMYSPPLLMDEKEVRWMPCEQQMYAELFGEPFPGKPQIDAPKTLEFQRRALARCWRRIHETVRATKPNCIIWLTCFDLRHPQLEGLPIFQEVDWLVNEHPDPTSLDAIRKLAGPKTKLWQCLCGWGDKHDPRQFLDDPKYADVGLCGFAAADPETTLPFIGKSANRASEANARNIALLREAFHRYPPRP